MLTIYLVCLIMGGVLVAASALALGPGHGDVDDGGDASHELGHDGEVAHDTSWLAFFSLRFWTFFAAFFGVTGVVIRQLDLTSVFALELASALGMGLASGSAVSWLFGRLKSSQVDSSIAVEDLEGLAARVILQIDSASEGRVRVATKGILKDLRATTEEDGTLERGSEVLVVRVQDGVAHVMAMPPSAALVEQRGLAAVATKTDSVQAGGRKESK